MGEPILKAQNLSRFYEVSAGAFRKKAIVRAMSDVSFELAPGKTLAVVGESGCGKSTLARVVTMIEAPSEGSFSITDKDVLPENWSDLRSEVQIVFQDPYGSLNPRQTIGQLLEEPLINYRKDMNKQAREADAREMLKLVGLRPEHYERYPHMFSGGQRQRIAIARALMLRPKILILDEPVSALDLSIQSQVLNLLNKLQEDMGLAYLFISHDLSVVKHIADEVMVMYLGRIVEMGAKDDIFSSPQHPYTKALFSATPIADPKAKKERIRLEGELPSPLNVPDGCAFAARCWKVQEKCRTLRPELEGARHKFACFYPGD